MNSEESGDAMFKDPCMYKRIDPAISRDPFDFSIVCNNTCYPIQKRMLSGNSSFPL